MLMITPNASAVAAHVWHASGEAKTVCTSSILAALGVDASTYRYSGRSSQRKAILRRVGYAVRSRLSRLKRKTVGGSRSAIRKMDDPVGTKYMLTLVSGSYGHAILLDDSGATVVDTDPREADRRIVVAIHAVFPKA